MRAASPRFIPLLSFSLSLPLPESRRSRRRYSGFARGGNSSGKGKGKKEEAARRLARSLATCADVEPDRKEGRECCSGAAANFADATGEKSRGGTFSSFKRSRQILRPLQVMYQIVYYRVSVLVFSNLKHSEKEHV